MCVRVCMSRLPYYMVNEHGMLVCTSTDARLIVWRRGET